MIKSIALSLSLLLAVLTVGCKTTSHPNQINAFDGSTYDTLTASRAALVALKTEVQTSYPKYTDQINTAIASYNVAYVGYGAFRTGLATDQLTLATELNDITLSIVKLEASIQADLKAKASDVEAAQTKVYAARASLKAHTSFVDVLTELELAATVAQAIPGASPYAALAQIVIRATGAAIQAVQALSGQPINLSLIGPITPIAVSAAN